MLHIAPSNERSTRILRFVSDGNALMFRGNRKLKGFHHANVRHKQTALELLNESTLLKPRLGGKRANMVERGQILLPNPQNPLSFAPRSARCLNFRLSEGAAMINRRPRDGRTDGRTDNHSSTTFHSERTMNERMQRRGKKEGRERRRRNTIAIIHTRGDGKPR